MSSPLFRKCCISVHADELFKVVFVSSCGAISYVLHGH